jgi:hypothetical protein
MLLGACRCQVKRVVALPHKDRHHPLVPPLLDRREDGNLVVDQDVVRRRVRGPHHREMGRHELVRARQVQADLEELEGICLVPLA